jgi:hypothetical protein
MTPTKQDIEEAVEIVGNPNLFLVKVNAIHALVELAKLVLDAPVEKRTPDGITHLEERGWNARGEADRIAHAKWLTEKLEGLERKLTVPMMNIVRTHFTNSVEVKTKGVQDD